MKKYYITFGQSHIHKINGKIIDNNCVCEILAENYQKGRKKAFELFGEKFAFFYENIEDVGVEKYYPRGIIKV